MKYFRPDSLDSAHKLFQQHKGKEVELLAGGTDLIPRFERGASLPDYLIDLKHLSELNSIEVLDQTIKIGALSTIQNIYDHAIIQSEFGALHQAAFEFAGPQIRHRGTIGGNICNASPAGDLLPSLYVFDATLTLQSSTGERHIPLKDFILGPGKTDLQKDELLTTISIVRTGNESFFQKLGLRQSMAISVVNLACVFKGDLHDPEFLNIAVGALAPTVVTLDSFCAAFQKAPDKLRNHLNLIDETISPIDDIRATASYRSKVLKNLINDFLEV